MILPHPGFRFAYAHPAHFIALAFGAGVSRFAPGTVGTLVAFPLWWLIRSYYGPIETLGIVAFFFVIGVWACDRTGRTLGVADHGAMCWDEVVAFLAMLALLPDEPWWQVAAFLLFRFFDVVKPSPIREVERRLKGGFGVMADDILAAGYALVVLALVKRFVL